VSSVPGVKNLAAVQILSEIGTDMSHFASDMYRDLGPNHFDERTKDRQKNRLVQRLEALGYAAELAPLPASVGGFPRRWFGASQRVKMAKCEPRVHT